MIEVLLGGALQSGIGIADWIKGAKDFKREKAATEKALAALPQYQMSPYAKEQLANAQANLNAINPAVQAMYGQAQRAAANTAATAQRNAMSGAEAIQGAALGQQIAQNQMPQIAQTQMQYEMANRNALDNALGVMTSENQNVFNSQNNIANQLLNYKMGLMGAAAARKAGGQKNTVGGVSAMGNALTSAKEDILGLLLGKK